MPSHYCLLPTLPSKSPNLNGASFDAITHTWLSRGGPSEAGRLRDDDVYFISYRWESVPHRQWVFRFATDLARHGYRVISDQFESLDLRDRIGSALRTDRMQDEIPRRRTCNERFSGCESLP